MPELPEVETIRRALEPALVGRVIVGGGAFPSAKFTAAADAVSAGVVAVGRRGKYLLVELDDDRELVVHLGMTGVLRRVAHRSDDAYLRAWWALDDGSVLEFSDVRRFGRIAVVRRGDYGTLPTLQALGPEPLSDDFSPASLHAAVRRSSVALKTQLLGQRVVAGVGNIYADEALWLARVSPTARSLTRPQAERLHGAIVEVLRNGIERRGTTLRDYRTFDGSEGSNQHHLRCYGRADEPCERCGTLLRRRIVDARGTTWCPSCQRR